MVIGFATVVVRDHQAYILPSNLVARDARSLLEAAKNRIQRSKEDHQQW